MHTNTIQTWVSQMFGLTPLRILSCFLVFFCIFIPVKIIVLFFIFWSLGFFFNRIAILGVLFQTTHGSPFSYPCWYQYFPKWMTPFSLQMDVLEAHDICLNIKPDPVEYWFQPDKAQICNNFLNTIIWIAWQFTKTPKALGLGWYIPVFLFCFLLWYNKFKLIWDVELWAQTQIKRSDWQWCATKSEWLISWEIEIILKHPSNFHNFESK